MIYIDLIEGKPAIDWERFDKLRADNPHFCFAGFAFTPESIASLQGSPNKKIQQLEKLLDSPATYEFRQKDSNYCCRIELLGRLGYGTGNTESRAKALAQLDLLSILCDSPIDAYRTNKEWDEFENVGKSDHWGLSWQEWGDSP